MCTHDRPSDHYSTTTINYFVSLALGLKIVVVGLPSMHCVFEAKKCTALVAFRDQNFKEVINDGSSVGQNERIRAVQEVY